MGKLLTCLHRLTLDNCEHFGQLQNVRATETLKSSHRPHGRLTCCLLLAGRWCLRLFWHGQYNVFLDLREYSLLCVCSCSKVPNAPMGNSRFARCLQGGGVLVYSGTVTITSSEIYGNTAGNVRAHLQKFPIAPMGRLLTCLPRLTLRLLNCGQRSGQLQFVRAAET